jgi:hypothetical protein
MFPMVKFIKKGNLQDHISLTLFLIIISFIPISQFGTTAIMLIMFVINIAGNKKNEIKLPKKITSQMYNDLIQEIREYLNSNKFDGNYWYTRSEMNSLITNIHRKYYFILKNDMHKETSYRKIKELLLFIDTCVEVKTIHDDQIKIEIQRLTESINDLLQPFVDDIININDKVNQQNINYIKQQSQKILENNKALKKDLEEYLKK